MKREAAIEAVYAAFSDADRPALVDGCPCCMTADQYETLTAKPLRGLTSVDLTDYACAVMLTMGSEDDFQYFLPRILELTIEDDADWLTSIEGIAEKMQMAGAGRWSENRRTAIEDLWLANIREMAGSKSNSFEINSWLCAATLIPIPVSPLLDILETTPDIIPRLYNTNFETLGQGRLKNSFLKESSDGQGEIVRWLRASLTR